MTKYIGSKYGKLTIVEHIEEVFTGYKTRHKRQIYRATCECGGEISRRIDTIIGGKVLSCGCSKRTFKNSAIRKLYTEYRMSAKRRGHSYGIDEDYLESMIFKNCHYCGDSPRRSKTVNSDTIIYNGLDRVNNSLGYEIDNLVTCCTICNSAKHILEYDEFISWIERLKTHEC